MVIFKGKKKNSEEGRLVEIRQLIHLHVDGYFATQSWKYYGPGV